MRSGMRLYRFAYLFFLHCLAVVGLFALYLWLEFYRGPLSSPNRIGLILFLISFAAGVSFFWIMTRRPGQPPSGSNETSVFKGTLLFILALAVIIWGWSLALADVSWGFPTAGTHAVDPCIQPNLGPVLATDRYDDPDAYSVYSVIVPTFPRNDKLGVWLIRRETVPNQKAWLLENRFNLRFLDRFNFLPKSYRLLSADELSKMFRRDSHDPSGEDWVQLSAVDFNADKTAAVVYMENYCCAGDGCLCA